MTGLPSATRNITLRSFGAVALWAFCLLWVGLVACLVFVAMRDGPSSAQSADLQFMALCAFVAAAAGLTIYAFTTPILILRTCTGGTVTFIWIFPLWWRQETCRTAALARPALRQDRDSDGDVWWRIVFDLPSGRRFEMPVGTSQPVAMREYDALVAALGETA